MSPSYSRIWFCPINTEDDICPGPKKIGKTVIGTSASPVSGVNIVSTE